MAVFIILGFPSPFHDFPGFVDQFLLIILTGHTNILPDFPPAVRDAGQYLDEFGFGQVDFFSSQAIHNSKKQFCSQGIGIAGAVQSGQLFPA